MIRIIKNLAFAVILSAGLLSGSGCATIDPVTGQQTRNFYTMNQEVDIGNQVFRGTLDELRAQGVPINQDPVRTAQLREMLERISSVSDMPDLPYEVALIHTNIVNAMAAPGGKIMVYEGLWDPQRGLVRDEEELAAVMAHEIAHVNCRHSTKAMTRNMLPSLLLMGGAAFAEANERPEIAQALSGAFILYNGIWVTRYSRRDEIEADTVGLMYMARAGYDPRAAVRIWERAAQHRGPADPVTSIFSTHPPDQARLENLRRHLPRALAVYEAHAR